MILTLDLSSKCTGFSKFSKDGKLMEKGQIIPDKNIDVYFKIHFVTEKVKELFHNADELVIEDIFLGSFAGKFNVDTLKYLARLSGAIVYAWIVSKYKVPKFYMASSARKLAGLNGHSQKAEIQIYVLENYTKIMKEQIKKYKKYIIKLQRELENKTLTKEKYKYRMNKFSELIEEQTGIGEDQADAIILGLAYLNDKNNEKN